MPLSLYILASGSKANSIVIKRDGCALLVDAGMGIRNFVSALQMVGLRPEQLTAVLITHEHGDHVRGLTKMLERTPLPVYASKGTLDALDYYLPPRTRTRELRDLEVEEINGFAVTPISIPHDAAGPLAYHFVHGEHRVTLATDLGEVPATLLKYLQHSTCAILESNHDEIMLRDGSYPDILKERIRSRTGHLSNKQTAVALRASIGNGLRTVVLAHLSEENNDPAIARASAAVALAGSEAALHVTTRSAMGPFLNIDLRDQK